MEAEDPLVIALRALCATNGGHDAVAKRIDVNGQSIYQIVARVKLPSGKARGVGRKVREKLDAVYPGWQQAGYAATTDTGRNPRAASNDALYVPLLQNTGSMGRGSNILDADVVVGELPLGRLWVSEFLRPSSTEKLRFMHAVDQSMIPTLSSGDVVLVDCGQRDPGSPDGVYVLGDAEHIYIKRVHRTLAGTLEVSSDNPAVKTAEALDGRKEIRVLGRAIWVWNGKRL